MKFIDTNDPQRIQQYQKKLQTLLIEFENTHKFNMAIVRNDDFFPNDLIWRENSEYTEGEYTTSLKITNAIRLAIAKEICLERKKQEEPQSKKIQFLKKLKQKLLSPENQFEISDELYNTLQEIPQNVGATFIPTYFRSTKHFTLNTPLGYTTNYNPFGYKTRKFTVIDNINNFINSGYGYSIDPKDCYLDITHEGLKISPNGIVLISEEYYNELKNNDPEYLNILNKINLYVYRGTIEDAINMILCENNFLPFNPKIKTNPNLKYDENTQQDILNYLKNYAEINNLKFSQDHGGPYSHFTSMLDQYYYSAFGNNHIKPEEYIVHYFNYFLNENFTVNDFNNLQFLENLINTYSIETILSLIENYNVAMKNAILENKEQLIKTQDKISKETQQIFKEAFKKIQQYYEINPGYYNTIENNSPFLVFFQSHDIEKQKEAAIEIINLDLNNTKKR